MRAYTRGCAHRQRVSTTVLTRTKTPTIFVCAPDGVGTSDLRILSPTLSDQLNHPVTRFIKSSTAVGNGGGVAQR